MLFFQLDVSSEKIAKCVLSWGLRHWSTEEFAVEWKGRAAILYKKLSKLLSFQSHSEAEVRREKQQSLEPCFASQSYSSFLPSSSQLRPPRLSKRLPLVQPSANVHASVFRRDLRFGNVRGSTPSDARCLCLRNVFSIIPTGGATPAAVPRYHPHKLRLRPQPRLRGRPRNARVSVVPRRVRSGSAAV